MHDRNQWARLTRSPRARVLTALLAVVLLAGCATGSHAPAQHPQTHSAVSSTDPGCLLAPATCYAPHLLRVAYGIQPLLDDGIDGRGETVTVLDPAPAPNTPAGPPANPGAVPASGFFPAASTDIRQDLKAFDRLFHLPAAQIKTVTALAGSASPWQASVEEVADLEIVHLVAPAATLRVVLIPENALASAASATADMLAGLRLAVSDTDVASISFSLGEHAFTTAQVAQMQSTLATAAASHVTVTAASGNFGAFSDTWAGATAVKEVSLPASDPLVLAVGGTTLTVDPSTGGYVSETAWNQGTAFDTEPEASAGGFSHLFARPAYQDGVPGIGAMRGVPDVAADADQQGAPPMVFSVGGKTSITSAAGTSNSAPLWAGLIALADQYAQHDLGPVNSTIYGIARGTGYHQAFHDITTGNNTLTLPYPAGTAGYPTAPGWDPVTGWGSPDAQVLVPLLAGLTSPSPRPS